MLRTGVPDEWAESAPIEDVGIQHCASGGRVGQVLLCSVGRIFARVTGDALSVPSFRANADVQVDAEYQHVAPGGRLFSH